METLIQIDRSLFEWINSGWSNSFFDTVMPFLRRKENWIPFYAALLIFLVWKFRWTGLIVALALGASVAVGDQISSSIIKPWIDRMRPCHVAYLFEEFNLLAPCGAGKSFTSSHATNHFALAVCLGWFFRHRKWVMITGILWAGSISIAQVYVGVHYPIDILAGSILGSLIGLIIAYNTQRFILKKENILQHKIQS